MNNRNRSVILAIPTRSVVPYCKYVVGYKVAVWIRV